MGRKKNHEEEHVNLERWMVSYSDFVTLLFATFVVLYALSQVDIKDFEALERSIQQAFAAPSIMQGADGLMTDSASGDLFDSAQADSMITPLMMEFISQKYEEEAMRDIEKDINAAVKQGDIEGVQATKTEKGLLIRFSDDFLFDSGSATLKKTALKKLDKVGVIIAKKFVLHNIRIEGHTDNQPIQSKVFPSNWELSSARASSIARYFINRLKFMPSVFTVVGFADTRPIATNATAQERTKNRRVEVLILKNKYKSQENPVEAIKKMSKKEQEAFQAERTSVINRIGSISDAAKELSKGDKKAEDNAIILNDVYTKEVNRISNEAKNMDVQTQKQITGNTWLKSPSKVKGIDKVNVFGK